MERDAFFRSSSSASLRPAAESNPVISIATSFKDLNPFTRWGIAPYRFPLVYDEPNSDFWEKEPQEW